MTTTDMLARLMDAASEIVREAHGAEVTELYFRNEPGVFPGVGAVTTSVYGFVRVKFPGEDGGVPYCFRIEGDTLHLSKKTRAIQRKGRSDKGRRKTPAFPKEMPANEEPREGETGYGVGLMAL